ncbi:hypothetical protein SORBI_3003G009200 [Sorghum bicolor]|uniref:Uncharacterized protein n=1 Tax=Sorghum bicolor TaxID=4558 RepID=A0A1W0VVD6_SORBI|nr:hypothetical protein SORBI_3003G009200 [Sorghum bicolor]
MQVPISSQTQRVAASRTGPTTSVQEVVVDGGHGLPPGGGRWAAAAVNGHLLYGGRRRMGLGRQIDAFRGDSICFEKVAAVSYSGLIVAPDGSGRALVWNQQGKVWLASMPAAEEMGAAMPMRVGDSPFIDLSSLARYDEARGLCGLVSVVFHPRMDVRLFVSYTTKSNDDCGHTAVEASTGWCTILVVKELSPREGGFKATTVFSMDVPAAQAGFSLLDHGGQIFFRPNDPSLYLVTGHGVSTDFISSNKSSLLGKILRLHVDHDMPGLDRFLAYPSLRLLHAASIHLDKSRGSSCSLTRGRTEDPPVPRQSADPTHSRHPHGFRRPLLGTDAEVFFSGLNIPRGCALDYSGSLFCANIDETQGELVYLIFDNNPSSATSVVVLDLKHPMAPGSIVWGLQYHGSADASLSGRYIYAYNSALWSVTMESQPSSGRYTLTQMVVACSRTTPMPCQDSPIVVSFAEDQNKEGIILATDGVYRIAASSLCAGGPLGLGLGPAPTPRRHSLGKMVAAVFGSAGAMGTVWRGCSGRNKKMVRIHHVPSASSVPPSAHAATTPTRAFGPAAELLLVGLCSVQTGAGKAPKLHCELLSDLVI